MTLRLVVEALLTLAASAALGWAAGWVEGAVPVLELWVAIVTLPVAFAGAVWAWRASCSRRCATAWAFAVGCVLCAGLSLGRTAALHRTFEQTWRAAQLEGVLDEEDARLLEASGPLFDPRKRDEAWRAFLREQVGRDDALGAWIAAQTGPIPVFGDRAVVLGRAGAAAWRVGEALLVCVVTAALARRAVGARRDSRAETSEELSA